MVGAWWLCRLGREDSAVTEEGTAWTKVGEHWASYTQGHDNGHRLSLSRSLTVEVKDRGDWGHSPSWYKLFTCKFPLLSLEHVLKGLILCPLLSLKVFTLPYYRIYPNFMYYLWIHIPAPTLASPTKRPFGQIPFIQPSSSALSPNYDPLGIFQPNSYLLNT